MQKAFYRFALFLGTRLGRWAFKLVAWFVAAGFFIFFPSRVGNSLALYRHLYPQRRRWFHLCCAWRQFHSFTDVFIDRLLIQSPGQVAYRSEGFEHLAEALNKGKGAILLMSHVGNWDIAAQLLMAKLPGTKVLLYMGAKQKEQIEQMQKAQLSEKGIRIVAVSQDGGSPLDILEGIRFLENGGVVSLTGDMIWKEDQRTVKVFFLGREIRLPQAPHLIALLSGAPLLTYFAFRAGKNRYHLSMSPPAYVTAADRSRRMEIIRRSAQSYASILEANLQRYPLQWYHFEPFFV